MAGKGFAFDIDAGKVLAKMHLGGCQTHKDCLFFNAGIINNAKLVPEDVTQKTPITFDFSNKSGEYELGVILPEFQIDLKHSIGDISGSDKELNEDAQSDATAEAEAKSGIMDSAESVDAKKEKAAEQEKNAEQEKTVDQKEQEKDEKNPNDPSNKMLADDQQSFADKIQAQKKIAIQYLQDYMKVFGGEENMSKITDANVIITFIPEKEADPYKIKTYQNNQIPMTELKTVMAEFDKLFADPKLKKITLKNICFKTLYSLKTVVEK